MTETAEHLDTPYLFDRGKQITLLLFPPAMMKQLLSSLDLKPYGCTLWIRRVGFTQLALTQASILYRLVWTLIFSLKLNNLERNVMSVLEGRAFTNAIHRSFNQIGKPLCTCSECSNRHYPQQNLDKRALGTRTSHATGIFGIATIRTPRQPTKLQLPTLTSGHARRGTREI